MSVAKGSSSVSSAPIALVTSSTASFTSEQLLILERRRTCGNNLVEFYEGCDDGNTVPGDGCSSSCSVELALVPNIEVPQLISVDSWQQTQANLVAAAGVCGNGTLEMPEECDDSNRRSDDGCSESCLLEIGICGDGKVQKLLGEQCEQSTHDPALPYMCSNCRYLSKSCGDGKMDPGEECDKGTENSYAPNAACRKDCSLSRCGDGILDTAEQCDDGNRRTKDGCDSLCRKETIVAGEQTTSVSSLTPQNLPITNNQSPITNIPFAYQQPQPYALPFASLQPLIAQVPSNTQTGPAAVAAIGAGAAAGFSWIRRRKK